MCGIIGYIGKPETEVVPLLMNGLRRMEYRGYDSAGIAIRQGSKIKVVKKSGKLTELAAAVKGLNVKTDSGIGHTRWATHGVPSVANAHPHRAGSIVLVHNGIIENHAELKQQLSANGAKFAGETDSEVLAWLVSSEIKKDGDLPQAVTRSLKQIDGTFGLVVMDEDSPDVLVGARRGSPLLLGIGQGETYLASDATAIVAHTDKVVYLEDDDLVICHPGKYQVVDLENRQRNRQIQTIELELSAIEKAGYDHFLIKEIMEQPKAVTDILRGRIDLEEGSSHLGGLNLLPGAFRNQRRFLTIGCGTAYYAGLLGKYLLERLTGIPVDVEYGSEFRYRQPALSPGTLALFVSQSGETADTLASLREVKRHGIHTLGLVNVVGSSVAREVNGGIYLHAGPEVSVASTKAFTSQVVAHLLLGLTIARSRDMSLTEGLQVAEALSQLPAQIEQVLKVAPQVQKLAAKLAKFDNAMFLGRDSLYPVALEGSHKLKEVSYVHAEAYPAGEMKHGANALIDNNLLVVFLLPQNDLYAKAKSNLEEVRARGGHILVVASEGDKDIAKLADDVIYIPRVSSWIEPIIANIPLQLLAYYVAVERGTNVDQPRNLAKSVTVE